MPPINPTLVLRSDQETTPDVDYRRSHLERGEEYDRELDRGDFETYMTIRERSILARVVSRLFPRPIPRYLDFACGTGRITQVMESKASVSYGVDVSPGMIEQARRKCSRTTFIERDLTTDASGLEPFDVVTAFRFFGNAEDELRRGVLRALRPLMVEGGYLIINNHRNPRSLNNLLLRALGTPVVEDLDYTKLAALLREAGFRIERTYGIGWWVVLSRLHKPRLLASWFASLIEPLSLLPYVGRFCPDAIIVARAVALTA